MLKMMGALRNIRLLEMGAFDKNKILCITIRMSGGKVTLVCQGVQKEPVEVSVLVLVGLKEVCSST